jgi:hypothetical protein
MKFERKIIALCGRAQHGKSTLARQIAAYYGAENVAVTAFATVPKRMLRVFGLTEDELRGNSKGTPRVILGGQTPRYAMQTLATEWGRNMLYDEVWVDAWERDLVELAKPIIVVEDVRHEPEIDRLEELGACLVEVFRPDLMPGTRMERLVAWLQSRRLHSSERLDFSKFGIPRLYNIGDPSLMLPSLLKLHPELYLKPGG